MLASSDEGFDNSQVDDKSDFLRIAREGPVGERRMARGEAELVQRPPLHTPRVSVK